MSVVRHDYPRLNPVVASIGFEQYLLDKFRHVPMPKPALAVTAIQPLFKLSALCGIVRLVQDRFPLSAARHGKGIVELKRNELGDTRGVEVIFLRKRGQVKWSAWLMFN